MNTNSEKDISVEQFKLVVKEYSQYFSTKWKLLFIIGFFSGVVGIVYAWLQKPLYVAEITFAAESESASPLGGYAGLAAQFGFDAGGSNGAFEGENLVELMHSKMLIEKTLLSPVLIEDKKELLINYYIRKNKYDKKWAKDPKLNNVKFLGYNDPPNRDRDSILKKISAQLSKNSLRINKVDKKLNFISAKMEDGDEYFAKAFIEKLVSNVIQYYTDYKSKKARQNVDILKHQADSVRNMLSGNIVEIAVTNDLNVNPLRQVARTSVQRKQVDVQVNSALYGELVKNLELSRITLRKETPLIQIIDTPSFPLEKKKLGRFLGGFLFGFVGFFLALFYFFIKKLLRI